MKENKENHHRQQVEEERDAAYARMIQNVEKTRV